MPEDRIQILADALDVDRNRFSEESVEVINSLSKHEFDCILILRSKLIDGSSAQNHYDHALFEGI